MKKQRYYKLLPQNIQVSTILYNGEIRYIAIDKFTGEVLDCGDGSGYETKEQVFEKFHQ